MKVLVINPGSTSTKLASFNDEGELWREILYHPTQELSSFKRVVDQYDYRMRRIIEVLSRREEDISSFDAVVGRGGVLDPLEGGTYIITPKVLQDLRRGKPWEHASNLGGIIAFELAKRANIPAFIVDPVSVDELEEVARFTGLPFIKKRSLFHALNIRAVARKTAEKIGKKFEEANFVIAHLGGGISVVAIRRGKAIDVNNANEMGPFSPERTGGLPPLPLVRLAIDKGYTFPEVKRLLAGNGGVKAYLGTADLREVRKMIEEKDTKAELVYKAMIYQIAKEIGSMYASLQGKVDAIAITGGIAHDDIFVKELEKYIDWMAKVFVFEGEFEMEALALGALRVLKGEEKAKHYKEGRLS